MMYVIAIIILLAGIGTALFIISRRKQTAQRQAIREQEDLQCLEHKIERMYRETGVNFALYSESGERKMLVIQGERQDNESVSGGILCNNLFENPVFTPELAGQLKREGAIVSDIDTLSNLHTALDADKKAVYNISIRKLENNPAYQYIAVAKDITRTVENKAEKERFEKLIEFATKRSSVGIAFYNIHTRKGKATDSWYANLCEERSGDKVLPKGEYLSAEVKAQVRLYLESLKQGNREPFSIDFEIQSPTGIKWIRLYSFVHQDKDPDNIEVIDLNVDITELKESENILIVLNRQVMEAKRESDKFLNSISHEIRTPLNSIMGFTNLFVNSTDALDRKDFEEIIKMNINQLIELVNNIILISKIDSHTMKIIREDVALNQLLASLRDETEKQLREDKAYMGKEVIVKCHIPEEEHILHTDKKLLTQVFSNLLSNAMKFTDVGGIILGYGQDGDQYTFYVKDTGPGIRAENFDQLFERFEKVDTFTQGTGLGLPLCKSILHCLDGEIDVESEPGKGSTFRFTIRQTIPG